MNILEAIKELLVAGLGMLFMHYRQTMNRNDVTLQKVSNDIYQRNNELEEQMTKLRQVLVAREKASILVNLSIDQFPFPVSVKDSTFRLISVNDKFVDNCGKTKEQCEGQRDHDLWPKDVADSLRIGDEFVINRKGPWIGIVKVMNHSGKVNLALSWKWPVVVGMDVVAIGEAHESLDCINNAIRYYENN